MTDGSVQTDDKPVKSAHEDSTEEMATEGNVEVLRPYAIEEPADDAPEPASLPRRLVLPCPPDQLELWQPEVVERIGDTVEGDETLLGEEVPSVFTKRGQKRKPAGAASTGPCHPGFHRSKSKIRDGDPTLPGWGLHPKRRRRRSKAMDDMLKGQHSTIPLHEYRIACAQESSSSDVPSSSNREATREFATVDEMDID